jgi:hypothetical protein
LAQKFVIVDTNDRNIFRYPQPNSSARFEKVTCTNIICRHHANWLREGIEPIRRVFPDRTGKANSKGLDFYDCVLDDLLRAGIEPYCTLYSLGFTANDSGSRWLAEPRYGTCFCALCGLYRRQDRGQGKALHDYQRVQRFRPGGVAMDGDAPGLKLDSKSVAQLAHYALLRHGLAVVEMRAVARPGAKIGWPNRWLR